MQRRGDKDAVRGNVLRHAVRDTVVRVPLLLPLLVVLGVIWGGQAGWISIAVGLALGVIARIPRVCLCGVLCGGVVYMSQELRRYNAEQLLRLGADGAVHLRGVVTDVRERSCVLETGWVGVRVELHGDILWRVGDELQVVGTPYVQDEPPVEGMYSPAGHLKALGVAGSYECRDARKVGESVGRARLSALAAELRSTLAGCLLRGATDEADPRYRVLCALVLGEKRGASPETMETFRRGGCLHAFAVSGLHVGIVAWLVMLAVKLLRVGPAVGRIVVLAVVGAYVVCTGLAVPAMRAYMMLLGLLGALILRRRMSAANTWCCAAIVILILQPWQLYQAGFRLSFAVYAAICLGVKFVMKGRPWFGPDAYIPKRLHTRAEHFFLSAEYAVRGAVVVSLSAWFISLPLCIDMFHVVNTVSYLTNAVLVPLLPIVMTMGILWLLLGWVPWIGPLLGSAALKSAGILLSVVKFFGDIPGAYLPTVPAAGAERVLAISLYHGKSFCVLGNPGVLIGHLDAERDARYSVQPALFHAGFRPFLVCGVQAGSSARNLYERTWPGLRCYDDRWRTATVTTFRTSAGSFTFYPPSDSLPMRQRSNRKPVLVWQRPDGSRVLYAGDAALSTLETLPQTELRADILILGYNEREPITDSELLQQINARRIILLPSAVHGTVTEESLAPARVQKLSRTGSSVWL